MTRRLSPADWDRLLQLALQRRIDAMGGVPVDPEPLKPWLPESYWREEAQVQKLMLRAAELEQERKRKAAVDLAYQYAKPEDIMKEWDAELPKLQGDNPRLESAGWGRNTMSSVLRYDRNSLRPPTPGPHQPEFHFECFQCGRPITIQGKDHAGRTVCDLAMLPQDMIDSESYWTDHTAKPWQGEEEDDDDDE